MKSFKQFIKETPEIDPDYEYKTDERKSRGVGFVKDSTTASGHTVKALRLGDRAMYYFHKPNSEVPDVRIGGIQKGEKFFENSLGKSEGSTLKAHHAYGHLLDQGIHLHSDNMHSPAGASVWRHLTKNPGHEVKLYSDKTKQYSDFKDFDSAYHPENKDLRIAIKKKA